MPSIVCFRPTSADTESVIRSLAPSRWPSLAVVNAGRGRRARSAAGMHGVECLVETPQAGTELAVLCARTVAISVP